MAVYANSTLTDISIPRIWDTKLLDARYAQSVIMPRVLNKSDKVRNMGEIVSIDIEPTFTVGAVTAATGAFTPQATAPTQANITINAWNYCAVEITRQAKAQSFWDPTNDFGTPAGKALSVQTETDLAGLHGSVASGNTVGTLDNPEQFDDQIARRGLLRLANLNVPKEGLTFVLNPAAWYLGWLAKVELTAAYATGLAKSTNITGEHTSILGVPAFESTAIATVATGGTNVRKGLLFHKEALGIAMQLEHDYSKESRVGSGFLSDVAVVTDLYGVKVVRSDHFITFNLRDE